MKYEGSSFHFFSSEGVARRIPLDVCDQLEEWPYRQSMS